MLLGANSLVLFCTINTKRGSPLGPALSELQDVMSWARFINNSIALTVDLQFAAILW